MLDFSHWVCVCERLIEDQIDIVRQCAERCLHVHARVGYEEGPRSPNRAPRNISGIWKRMSRGGG